MTRFLKFSTGALLILVLAAACDDSTTEANNANNVNNVNNTSNVNNTTSTNNVNNTTSTNNTNNVNNTNDYDMDTTTLTDACVNEADLAIIDGEDVNTDLMVSECTTEAVREATGQAGNIMCVERFGFSFECAACWGAYGQCCAAYCALPCYQPETEECYTCTAEYCSPEMIRCGGVEAGEHQF